MQTQICKLIGTTKKTVQSIREDLLEHADVRAQNPLNLVYAKRRHWEGNR